jgi:hypothetical protein
MGNEYPTKQELNRLEKWDFSTSKRLFALLDYLKSNWHYGGMGYYNLMGKNVLRLRLSTAGWSGNEDRIDALAKNLFWTVFWEKSVRGGHHFFKINLKTFCLKEHK